MNTLLSVTSDQLQLMSLDRFARWICCPVDDVTQWALDGKIPIVTIGDEQLPFVNVSALSARLLQGSLSRRSSRTDYDPSPGSSVPTACGLAGSASGGCSG